MCKIFDRRSKSPIALLTFLIQGVRMEPFTITMGMIANDFVTFRGAVLCRNLMALGSGKCSIQLHCFTMTRQIVQQTI